MAIQAVIFDFGNVLCFPPEPGKIEAAAQFCGMPLDKFWDAFWHRRVEYDQGLIDPATFWTSVTGEPFATANLPELIRHEVVFWNGYDERPFQWILKLRAAGIRIGLLTNMPRVLGEALHREHYLGRPFLDYFDHATFSYDLQWVKPQAEIYRHCFEGLQIAPQNALFLDDKLPNVHGAIDTGLRAELFTTWEEFLDRRVPSLYGLPDAP
ncbi:MAG: HAD family phosphatase [Acidobacteriota bacterium]